MGWYQRWKDWGDRVAAEQDREWEKRRQRKRPKPPLIPTAVTPQGRRACEFCNSELQSSMYIEVPSVCSQCGRTQSWAVPKPQR